MDLFEGFVGVRLWDQQPVNDTIFVLWLVLLAAFAMISQANQNLFARIGKESAFLKERLSVTKRSSGHSFVFQGFMPFQMLLLCSIGAFAFFRSAGYLKATDILPTLCLVGGFLLLFSAFYLFKLSMNELLGTVFAEPAKFAIWKSHYHTIMGLWGIALYLPVSWMIFTNLHIKSAAVLFAFLYILCRFVLIYKTICIFQIKSTGLLYISLYLCAQEIAPLVFLYEGTIYLFNFIESSAIWH